MFDTGEFTLHSGVESFFKVECDDLSTDDLRSLARLGRELVGEYGLVYGVPRGGLALAEIMHEWATPDSREILVVDDVWTTGDSWRREAAKHRNGIGVKGLVLFARGKPHRSVDAIWTLDHRLWKV